MKLTSSSWIEIDRKALLSNIEAFRSTMGADCALMVVVKANAYGHGLEAIASVVAEKVNWLGVNTIEEALAVEGLSGGRPIAILGHSPALDFSDIVRHGFRQVLFRLDMARALSEAAREIGKKALVHIKVETGTHRLGVPLFELEDFLRAVGQLPGLDVEGMYTHFANIEDTLDPSFAQLQLKRFQESLDVARRVGIEPRVVHTAASAGVILYPETHFSMVRVGLGAYGIWPSRETRIAARERKRELHLSPIATWKTRVAQTKTVVSGDYVGYGLTYQAPRTMRLAVIPVGFYDGYDRKLSNNGRALVHGRSVPVVGRVAMNMTMLDVTEAEAEDDDEVVLLGRQGDAKITAEEIAEKVGTITYEVVSRIHPGIPRIVV